MKRRLLAAVVALPGVFIALFGFAAWIYALTQEHATPWVWRDVLAIYSWTLIVAGGGLIAYASLRAAHGLWTEARS